MDAGALHLDWKFKVNNPHDSFLISGKLSNFYTEKLNDFLVPNLRTQTTGTIEQLYFTISGDEYTSSGDIKMRYEDFKFQLLNKERNIGRGLSLSLKLDRQNVSMHVQDVVLSQYLMLNPMRYCMNILMSGRR